MKSYGIHWFRRDLRVAGNLALRHQFKVHNGRALGVFCFDKKFLSRKDFSVNRFQFFLNSLKQLKSELQSLGSDLLVLDIGPNPALLDLIARLKNSELGRPELISWCRDYEPFSTTRDRDIKKLLNKIEVPYQTFRDHLLIEPHELTKDDGSFYQVYTPFAKRWLQLFSTNEIQNRVQLQKITPKYLTTLKHKNQDPAFTLSWNKIKGLSVTDSLNIYIKNNLKLVDIEIPPAGTMAAYDKLKKFKPKVDQYGLFRDEPATNWSSGLSPYFKNGSLTTSQAIHYLSLQPYAKKESGKDVYLSEIIWREFYYHILAHRPQVESEVFNKKYSSIKWQNNKKWFEHWKSGTTGFPIVDAAMRQLKTTGQMHNRCRMIVASFLTKDLLIDWRWGEKYFMEKLLDGDLAANNGGWQWAASTGCDAQPYFRIFNPWLQSKKFDPQGRYIKKFIPELNTLDAKKLHAPIENHPTYPSPIVDHKTQRIKAIELYKNI